MYNRFGFSSKKADNHRPSNQFSSVSHNRVGSIGHNGFTPSLGANQPNQQFSLGKDVASLRKVSTGSKFNFAGGNGIPSTAKSVRSMGFGSGHKKLVNSKLFGATPQHSRASYMQQNRPSTARLSRGSMVGRGGKDNRLANKDFHDECRAKIYHFLNENDYPQQITMQHLNRPSLSDVSRIFDFLFSFFFSDVVIKNGTNTSMDVVVPKKLAELCYPFQLKRSDLISFSGGRQLGAIFDSICYVIDVISYCNEVDTSRLNNQLDQDELANINNQLLDIAMNSCIENCESEDVDDNAISSLRELGYSFFGTSEDIERLEKEQDNLTESIKKLEDEIAKYLELPDKIKEYKQENEEYAKCMAELKSNVAGLLNMRQELLGELENMGVKMQEVLKEKSRIDAIVDSQKELVMPYRISVERNTQIDKEIDNVKQQLQRLNELILTSTLQENHEKETNSAFIGDIEDTISSFFSSVKSSKINEISPNFAKQFEEDKEWKQINTELKQYRNWNISVGSDDLVREGNLFGIRFQNKFKDFKKNMLQQLSALKGSASIEFICKKQELQVVLEKNRQQLKENEVELKKLIAEKEFRGNEERVLLDQLNSDIDLRKKRILDANKENISIEKQLVEVEEEISRLKKVVGNTKRNFMVRMATKVNKENAYIKSLVKENEEMTKAVQSSINQKREKLAMLQNYQI